jgi:hypothetical protein
VIERVYLLRPERFLRDIAAKTIADLTFQRRASRFNETEFSLNQADNLQAALGAADQLPMMSAGDWFASGMFVSRPPAGSILSRRHENLLSKFLDDPPGMP